MNKSEIKDKMWDNISTETELRKWKRRFKGALTEEHRQKCLYFIKLHGGGVENKN